MKNPFRFFALLVALGVAAGARTIQMPEKIPLFFRLRLNPRGIQNASRNQSS